MHFQKPHLVFICRSYIFFYQQAPTSFIHRQKITQRCLTSGENSVITVREMPGDFEVCQGKSGENVFRGFTLYYICVCAELTRITGMAEYAYIE